MMLQSQVAAFAAALALLLAGSAGASTLDGADVTATYRYPDTVTRYDGASGPLNFIVGAGVEGVIDVEGVTDLVLDLSSRHITVTLQTILIDPTWNSSPFNGLEFALNAGGPFRAVASVTASNGGPVSAYLTGNSLFLNWAGMTYDDGDTVTIALVPLPAGLPLLAGGLGAIALVSRRRRAG